MKEFNLLKKFNWELASQPIEVKPYKVYSALLNQNGTNAPTATVLENTLGDITFAYLADGTYSCNSNGLFTTNKTTGNSEIYYSADNDKVYYMYSKYIDINEFRINSMYDTVAVDDALPGIFLEIRVYN
jgi:hypothetical protein